MIKHAFALSAILFSSLPSSGDNGEFNDVFDTLLSNEQIQVFHHKDYNTNIGIITTDHGNILIDPMPGTENLSRLHNYLKTSPNKISQSCILNTHGHSDHAGGNKFLERNGATAYNSEHVSGTCTKLLHNLDLYETRSHSNRDTLIFSKATNILFAGDIVDNSWHPTIYAGGVSGFNQAIEQIMLIANSKTIIIPGHGVPMTLEEVMTFQKNTNDWIELITKLHEAGLTAAEITLEAEAQSQLQKFNTQNKNMFIPDKALRRFIEWTIALVTE